MRVGAAVDPSAFVAATETSDGRGSRVAAVQWVGEDGSREDARLVDLARRSETCRPQQPGEAGTTYCVPTRVARFFVSSPDFADAGCTKPVAAYRTDSQATCNAPPTAARDRMFYEIGAKAKAVFRGAPGNCRTITSDGDHYEVGAALPLSALPVLSTQYVGSGRIQLRTLVTESGSRVQVSTMFDAVKRLPCNPMMTDGKIRCLPSQVPSISTFSDAACTKPILEHYPGSAPVANGDLGLARMSVDSYAAVVLSSTIPRPAIFYYGNPGNCTTLTPTAGTTFYSTTLVAATEFAPVTRVVE